MSGATSRDAVETSQEAFMNMHFSYQSPKPG